MIACCYGLLPEPRTTNQPIVTPIPRQLAAQSFLNNPRLKAEERNEQILAAIRKFKRPCKFSELAKHLHMGNKYINERLRALHKTGRIKREKYTLQHYVYWIGK